jgi:hypothetical protein
MFTSEPNTQIKQGKRRCPPKIAEGLWSFWTGARAREACPNQYDLRLSTFFSITPGLWMNLQLDYDFMRAEREKGDAIRKEVQRCAA